MNNTCLRCGNPFDADKPLGYCPECVSAFRTNIDGIRRKQNPGPGILADGKFSDDKLCPQTIQGDDGAPVCGLCGSGEIDAGYGLGGGYGIGGYNYCLGCNTFLDFCEEKE